MSGGQPVVKSCQIFLHCRPHFGGRRLRWWL